MVVWLLHGLGADSGADVSPHPSGCGRAIVLGRLGAKRGGAPGEEADQDQGTRQDTRRRDEKRQEKQQGVG